MKELYDVHCPECGIIFGFQNEVKDHWEKDNKVFYCPNGHGMSWPKKSSELIQAQTKIKTLQASLDESRKEITSLKSKIEELKIELEIWQPSKDIVANNIT